MTTTKGTEEEHAAMTNEGGDLLCCRMLHHGAAATSSSKVVICVVPPPPSTTKQQQQDETTKNQQQTSSSSESSSSIVYASNAILNIAKQTTITVSDKKEKIWKVYDTLRTKTKASPNSNNTVATVTAKRVITCVSQLKYIMKEKGENDDEDDGIVKNTTILVCGFSDGSITTWSKQQQQQEEVWKEQIIVDANSVNEHFDGRAITDIGGIYYNGCYKIVTCSSAGAYHYAANFNCDNIDDHATTKISKHSMTNIHTAANTVRYQTLQVPSSPTSGNNKQTPSSTTLILVGTAAPRHNKIHIFIDENFSDLLVPTYCGALTGHENWISCFGWFSCNNNNVGGKASDNMLASGSQDARIRLWKFRTTATETTTPNLEETDVDDDDGIINKEEEDDDESSEDENNADLEEDMDEDLARVEFATSNSNGTTTISVFLEALLIGHEERVTSVAWHPKPLEVYNQELVLFSSSMDRTILIWSEHESGVWTPVSRVGSAGGILGGPIGSSLLGFLNVLIEPTEGSWLAGHGYGGAIHFFSCESRDGGGGQPQAQLTELSIEERAALIPWRAQPCITGHFDGVTDLCWEAANGDYLVTVSNDHTCRIWIPFDSNSTTSSSISSSSTPQNHDHEDVWIEIARPQVHGYNLSAITSLSAPGRRHTLISGADEKEIRVFDATQNFVRLLARTSTSSSQQNKTTLPADDKKDDIERVERAYIPSLGLSNKESAADGAEEDTTSGVSVSTTSLPLERDLGSVSIWPEVSKLFGHSSELARLTCTLSAKSGVNSYDDDDDDTSSGNDVLVASTAKARDANAACIRIWDVKENKCVQILAGGHRSTVTAIGFSPDGKYLASSGKDRRLCLWQRNDLQQQQHVLVDAKDSSHKRIVWSLHFCPFNPSVLASGSRDGSVKIWTVGIGSREEEESQLKEVYQFNSSFKETTGSTKSESVTALAFAPIEAMDMSILAVGLECGVIEIWGIPAVGSSATATEDGISKPTLVLSFPQRLCHIGSVTKLAWRPIRPSMVGENKHVRLILASSSSDHGCRIYEIATSF